MREEHKFNFVFKKHSSFGTLDHLLAILVMYAEGTALYAEAWCAPCGKQQALRPRGESQSVKPTSGPTR